MCTGASIKRLQQPTVLASHAKHVYFCSFLFQMLYFDIIGVILGRFDKGEKYQCNKLSLKLSQHVAERKALANDMNNMLARMERRDDN